MVGLRLESNGVEARTGSDLKFSRTFLKFTQLHANKGQICIIALSMLKLRQIMPRQVIGLGEG